MHYHSLRTPTWNITESWELPTDGFQSLGFEIAGATLWGRLGLHVRRAEVANNDFSNTTIFPDIVFENLSISEKSEISEGTQA